MDSRVRVGFEYAARPQVPAIDAYKEFLPAPIVKQLRLQVNPLRDPPPPTPVPPSSTKGQSQSFEAAIPYTDLEAPLSRARSLSPNPPILELSPDGREPRTPAPDMPGTPALVRLPNHLYPLSSLLWPLF